MPLCVHAEADGTPPFARHPFPALADCDVVGDKHEIDALPGTPIYPALHTQSVAATLPTDDSVFSLHCEQDVAPSLDEKLPALQGEQDVDPAEI